MSTLNVLKAKDLPLGLARQVLPKEEILKTLNIDLVPGKDGKDGEDGKDGKNAIVVLKEAVADNPEIVLGCDYLVKALKGKDGEDGKNGLNGKPGKDGKNGLNGKSGKDGKNGLNGKPGKDGKNGIKGKDGKNGKNGLNGKPGKNPSKRELTKAIRDELTTELQKNKIVSVTDVNIEQHQSGADLVLNMSDGEVRRNKFTLQFSAAAPRKTKISEESSTLPEDTILYLASIAPSTATYTDDKLTTLTYSDFQGITNHTKTLTYTNDLLTSTQENFDYDGRTWTVDITLTYSSGVWQSKNINISKV